MKKRMSFVWLLLALLLGGCAAKPTEMPPETAIVTEAPVHALDEAELSAFEELFAVMLPGDGQMRINPLNCFLTSCYDRAEDIDMRAFLRYFPGAEYGGEAEFEALRALPGWPFAQLDSMADMPVPLSRYDAEDVRQALEKYAGLSLEAVDISPESGVYYLEAYDAFYNYTSDFGLEQPDFCRGERQGELLRLYWQHPYEGLRELTLRETESGCQVVSVRRVSE